MQPFSNFPNINETWLLTHRENPNFSFRFPFVQTPASC
jgi:hypothetical protein